MSQRLNAFRYAAPDDWLPEIGEWVFVTLDCGTAQVLSLHELFWRVKPRRRNMHLTILELHEMRPQWMGSIRKCKKRGLELNTKGMKCR